MMSPIWQWLLEANNQQFLLGCSIALMLGMVIGRRIRKTKKRKGKSVRRNGDEAFFKGIQYILSNDHDHAIEEFTKSVQLNSETIETYVALGNLYRSKGDIERAIRIRQSIILRPNIDEEIKLSALFDLGVDYRNGGFLNRALSTFLKVTEKDASNLKALEEVEKIHEELKDWENAYQTRKKIARLAKGDHGHILAHHSVELGKGFLEKEEYAKAITYFNRALSIHEKCIDAYLHLGDLYFDKQEYKKAISTWKKVAQVAPRFTFLAYRRLEGAYSKMENLKPVEEFLKECTKLNSDAFTHLALARYLYNENDHDGTLREIDSALELDPNFWEARRFKGEILLSHGQEKEVLSDYRELIEYLDVPYLKSQCSECGFQPNELQWQCPQCKKWDTIHLIDSTRTKSSAISTAKGRDSNARKT
ncbi:MAG: tetratricopeptide repeat protein [Desulfobacterales bacterium]|nr:tetratricopeptide repeat protein [Desulfobacterales bacterium]